MPEIGLPQRIREEMRGVIAELERLTHLPSQWNNQIEITPTSNRAFGGKTFGCLIRIRADIATTEARWLTMIHEALHCFSTERSADASLRYPGYEEGVVESLQIVLRQEILDALTTPIPAPFCVDRDIKSAYTDYRNALEAMREALGLQEPRIFYLELLAAPLEQRWALLHERASHSVRWQEPDFRRNWRKWERILSGEEF